MVPLHLRNLLLLCRWVIQNAISIAEAGSDCNSIVSNNWDAIVILRPVVHVKHCLVSAITTTGLLKKIFTDFQLFSGVTVIVITLSPAKIKIIPASRTDGG